MIWNKKTANLGDRETRTCFAWFPVDLDEPEYGVIWLQKYKQDFVYREYGWDNHPYAWCPVKTYVD